MSGATKTQRLNLRANSEQEQIIRAAAKASDTTVSDFVMTSALTQAERVLADRRSFIATPEQFQEFVSALETPVDTARLRAFLRQPSVFDQPIAVRDEE